MSQNLNPRTQQQLDALYGALIDSHEGLSDEQSSRLNSSLILLLLQQIDNTPGNSANIQQALAEAREFALDDG